MPPHQIFGLSWAEMLSILSILGIIYAGIKGLLRNFRNTIMDPLNRQMKQLSDAIKELSKNSISEHQKLENHLNAHDIHFAKNDEDINLLKQTVGIKKRNRDETNEEN
ncbi:hypothetical protein [Lapidilactobacillus wuchangensis]|uniref:hypothetical protein n=1 Tax=Lapidilactobacillus wuchangensis TaxID=2486001 RepID=UPI000F780D19|nr:hypothetical protein [Lapidilactobacillus wuchangensis]